MLHKYYEILGIDSTADKESIKKAYRQKALEYHPDVNPSDASNELFLQVKEAFDVLYYDKQPTINRLRQKTANKKEEEKPKYTYHYRRYGTKRDVNFKKQNTQKTKEAPESLIGLQISLYFFLILRYGGFAMLLLPLLVIFIRPAVFFSLSTIASFAMGWYLFVYSKDWIKRLKRDVKRRKRSTV